MIRAKINQNTILIYSSFSVTFQLSKMAAHPCAEESSPHFSPGGVEN
jgi:hypothetical protein